MTKYYCPHGATADHDWESANSQVFVCVAYLKFEELDAEVQERIREEAGSAVHCICCHRAFSSLVEAAWDFGQTDGKPGFGMCVTCNHEQCGVHGFMEACHLQVKCVTPRTCKEVTL